MAEGKTEAATEKAVTKAIAALDLGTKEEEVTTEGEEVLAAGASESKDDDKFDAIVGAIESVMMDPAFRDAQETFCRDNCEVFEDSDENKLAYTALFEEYTTKIEALLLEMLAARIEGFSMEEFMRMLTERKEQLAGDILDMLTSFGDFEEFKGLMLSHKAQLAFEAGGESAGAGLVFAPVVISMASAKAE